MKFSEIIGQIQLKSKLIGLSRDGRLSHAILLCEKGGYGALSLAVALARYNSCPARTAEDSCGSCPTCSKFSKLIHPDLHFSFPVNATKKINSEKKPVSDHFISTFRSAFLADPYIEEQDWYRVIDLENKQGIIGVNEASLIIRKLSLKPFENGSKYLIIWLPERMNQEAANRLLKTLEEPPDETYILLVSKNPERIIPTIVSRCQVFEVPPIDTDIVTEWISRKYGLTIEESQLWARVSGGSISKVNELMVTEKEGEEYYDYTAMLLEGSLSRNLLQVIDAWEKIAALGREKQKAFCISTMELIRRIFIVSLGMEDLSFVTEEQKSAVHRWASAFKPSFYKKSYEALNSALADIERNVNSKFIFADLGNRFFLYLQ